LLSSCFKHSFHPLLPFPAHIQILKTQQLFALSAISALLFDWNNFVDCARVGITAFCSPYHLLDETKVGLWQKIFDGRSEGST